MQLNKIRDCRFRSFKIAQEELNYEIVKAHDGVPIAIGMKVERKKVKEVSLSYSYQPTNIKE